MTAMAGTLATTGRAEPAAIGGGPVVGSLVELLRARCADAFDRPAIVEPTGRAGPQPGRMPEAYATTRELSWGVLIAAAVDLAAHFERSGLGRGDRLAHIGPQSPEWIVVDLACLLSGIVHVALHADEPRAALVEQLGWLGGHGRQRHASITSLGGTTTKHRVRSWRGDADGKRLGRPEGRHVRTTATKKPP